ncbi:MAG: heterodisulfide reductase-related iron-sulfur binding cluster [Pseudorhodoplanes sp.]
MAKKISYTTVFERTRMLGSVIAPQGFHFRTEMAPGEAAEDVVLHVSCQVANVPHVAYLAQRILEKLDVKFTTLGGPEYCCGAYHWHFGDLDFEKQIAKISLSEFRRIKTRTVLSICPSCDDSFGRHKVPVHNFRQCNIAEMFMERIGDLKAMMQPVPCKIILHEHDADETRRRNAECARRLIELIPGVEILPSYKSMGPGIGCQSVAPMSAEDTDEMFEEAVELGADYLVVPYHSCYRQHCKMQLKFGVEVQHYLGLMARSLRIPFEEKFKELRLLDDVDQAIARLRPRIQELGYREEDIRKYVSAVIYM